MVGPHTINFSLIILTASYTLVFCDKCQACTVCEDVGGGVACDDLRISWSLQLSPFGGLNGGSSL